MKLYKVLEHRHDGALTSPYQNYALLVPCGVEPGPWTRRIRSQPVVGLRGYHLTTRPWRHMSHPGLVLYQIFEAEGRGLHVQGQYRGIRDQHVFQSIRLVRELWPWQWPDSWWQTPTRLRRIA